MFITSKRALKQYNGLPIIQASLSQEVLISILAKLEDISEILKSRKQRKIVAK